MAVQVSTNEAQNSLYIILKARLPELADRAKAGDEASRRTAQALIQLGDKMQFKTEQFAGMLS
jgi:hypothetical protein